MGNILIIEGNKKVPSHLSDIVRSEGYAPITADNKNNAIEKIKKYSPDLILLDINFPGINGIGLLEKIKKCDNQAAVIIITSYGNIKDAVKSIKMGAFNYISTPFDNDELLLNIKEALNTKYLNPSNLTPREKEILAWLRKGKTSWDLSKILNISERTVNFHIKNVMQKLDAVSRTHAVAKAMEMGLIEY